MPLRLATGGTARAGAPPRLSSLSFEETKASLCKKLLYNKRLDPQGEALLDALVDSGGQADALGEEWWAGKFILRSCHEFARALRAAGGPLLDGAPVTLLVGRDGSVELETDLLVLGCATGLRLFGEVAVGAAEEGQAEEGQGEVLRLTARGCEFFEPSEEFGITKALVRCEEVLRPALPSHESPLLATLLRLYSDGDTLCLSIEVEGESEGPLRLLLSRDEAEFDVAKRRRG